jgi:hypothetical protein
VTSRLGTGKRLTLFYSVTAPLLYPDICTVVGIRAEMRSPCTVLQPLHFHWLKGQGNVWFQMVKEQEIVWFQMVKEQEIVWFQMAKGTGDYLVPNG